MSTLYAEIYAPVRANPRPAFRSGSVEPAPNRGADRRRLADPPSLREQRFGVIGAVADRSLSEELFGKLRIAHRPRLAEAAMLDMSSHHPAIPQHQRDGRRV